MHIKYLENINKKADLINRIGIGDELEKDLEGDCSLCR
jgi:hypothetical protein